MRNTNLLLFLIIVLNISACKKNENTFKNDLKILNLISDIEILKNENSMIAVSGKLQGRVFTSSTKGLNGRSLGWFNKNIIKDGSYKTLYSRLGGEDRMWFGPQYGKFTVNCKPGTPLEEKNMRNPPDLNEVDFKIDYKSEKKIVSSGKMRIKNYQDFDFHMNIERSIAILNKNEIESSLNSIIPDNVSYVGFSSITNITNISKTEWSKEKGLLSIWILGCIKPSDNCVAIIPTRGNFTEVTNYFTPLDSSRVKTKDNIVYYKSDANYLNKIGILPEHTIPKFGTYSPELNLLTVVTFSFENAPYYVNSHKTDQTYPYKGDVINIFNDGVLGDVGPFGPFYELETSSAAKELAPEEKLSHQSNTFHFEGNKEDLNVLAKKILGVDLNKIPSF
jgi:hypothetical protein